MDILALFVKGVVGAVVMTTDLLETLDLLFVMVISVASSGLWMAAVGVS